MAAYRKKCGFLASSGNGRFSIPFVISMAHTPPLIIAILVLFALLPITAYSDTAYRYAVIPAVKYYDFEPNSEIRDFILVRSREEETANTMSLRIEEDSASSTYQGAWNDLGQYVSIESTEFPLPPTSSVEVYYTIQLPEDLKPGKHRAKLRLQPIVKQDEGAVGVSTSTLIQLFVIKPFPGTFGEVKEISSYSRAGEAVVFSTVFWNLGTLSIDEARVKIDIFDVQNNFLETIWSSQKRNILPGEEVAIEASLNTAPYEAGAYRAEVQAIYDGTTTEAVTSEFTLGKMLVELTSFEPEVLETRKINKLFLTLHNRWNKEVTGVWVDVALQDGEGNVLASNESNALRLEPNQADTLEVFLDLSTVPTGEYSLKARVHFNDQITLFEQRVKVQEPVFGFLAAGTSLEDLTLPLLLLIMLAFLLWKRKSFSRFASRTFKGVRAFLSPNFKASTPALDTSQAKSGVESMSHALAQLQEVQGSLKKREEGIEAELSDVEEGSKDWDEAMEEFSAVKKTRSNLDFVLEQFKETKEFLAGVEKNPQLEVNPVTLEKQTGSLALAAEPLAQALKSLKDSAAHLEAELEKVDKHDRRQRMELEEEISQLMQFCTHLTYARAQFDETMLVFEEMEQDVQLSSESTQAEADLKEFKEKERRLLEKKEGLSRLLADGKIDASMYHDTLAHTESELRALQKQIMLLEELHRVKEEEALVSHAADSKQAREALAEKLKEEEQEIKEALYPEEARPQDTAPISLQLRRKELQRKLEKARDLLLDGELDPETFKMIAEPMKKELAGFKKDTAKKTPLINKAVQEISRKLERAQTLLIEGKIDEETYKDIKTALLRQREKGTLRPGTKKRKHLPRKSRPAKKPKKKKGASRKKAGKKAKKRK